MTSLASFNVHSADISSECENVCTRAFGKLVDDLEAKGWSRKELALTLADIADDYVLRLATEQLPSAFDGNSGRFGITTEPDEGSSHI